MNSRILFAVLCVCIVGCCQGEDVPPPTGPPPNDYSTTNPPDVPDTTEAWGYARRHRYPHYPVYRPRSWYAYHRRGSPPSPPVTAPAVFPTAAPYNTTPDEDPFWPVVPVKTPSDTASQPIMAYPYNYWDGANTRSPADSVYPYTGWRYGTGQPENYHTTRDYWGGPTTSAPSGTSPYPYSWPRWGTVAKPYYYSPTTTPRSARTESMINHTKDCNGSKSDRVLVEMPGPLAADQDLHFALSLVPMMREFSSLGKLNLQVDMINMFKSKILHGDK